MPEFLCTVRCPAQDTVYVRSMAGCTTRVAPRSVKARHGATSDGESVKVRGGKAAGWRGDMQAQALGEGEAEAAERMLMEATQHRSQSRWMKPFNMEANESLDRSQVRAVYASGICAGFARRLRNRTVGPGDQRLPRPERQRGVGQTRRAAGERRGQHLPLEGTSFAGGNVRRWRACSTAVRAAIRLLQPASLTGERGKRRNSGEALSGRRRRRCRRPQQRLHRRPLSRRHQRFYCRCHCHCLLRPRALRRCCARRPSPAPGLRWYTVY